MKITVQTSGGFAGIKMPPIVLESDDESVRALVVEAVAAEATETDQGMDMMQYEITIEDGDSKQHLSFKNRMLPRPVLALVDRVRGS